MSCGMWIGNGEPTQLGTMGIQATRGGFRYSLGLGCGSVSVIAGAYQTCGYRQTVAVILEMLGGEHSMLLVATTT